jgi:hypothetical protein
MNELSLVGNAIAPTHREPSEPSAIGLRHVLTPTTVNEAMDMAQLFHASSMYQVASVAQAFVVLSMGMELGLTATQAFRSIHVIKGKPCPSADLLVGLVKSSSACIYFKILETTNERATYETHRHGEDPISMTYTMDDAREAGVTDMYRKYPANMLRARCASNLARAVYPDVCAGMYVPEEMDTIDIPVQPRAEAPQPAPVETTRDSDHRELYDAVSALIKAMDAEGRKYVQERIKGEFGKPITKLSTSELRQLHTRLLPVESTPVEPEEGPQDDPFADSPSSPTEAGE